MANEQGYSPPVPSGLTKAAVHACAEHVAKQLGYEPGADLTPILTKLGGKLIYQDFAGLTETDSGSLIVHGEANFEVRIATNTSPSRDRFTIAHELGHYVLHYLYARQHQKSEIQQMVANRYGSDRTEWEANWFAAAFLMPEEAFRKAHAEVQGSLFELADKFGVSPSAADVRAKALGL